MNNRGIKKPPVMASAEFRRLFGQISKAALIDALWCACQLSTDDSIEQIASKAAREVQIALDTRGDRVPADIRACASLPIDSD